MPELVTQVTIPPVTQPVAQGITQVTGTSATPPPPTPLQKEPITLDQIREMEAREAYEMLTLEQQKEIYEGIKEEVLKSIPKQQLTQPDNKVMWDYGHKEVLKNGETVKVPWTPHKVVES